MVRWLERLRDQGRIDSAESGAWCVVFVPISVRFDLHRPEVYFEAIAARLAELLGQEIPPTPTDKAAYYASHCGTLARDAANKARRILVVLDGIDEALGRRFDARWFPRQPGTTLRLLVTARQQPGDHDGSGWQQRLDWDRRVQSRIRTLPVIDHAGVADLLVKLGAPIDLLAQRPAIIDRLHQLSEGEPLVLGYYAEDIWARGDAAPRLSVEDLSDMQPGFGGFFKQWLKDQEDLWSQAGDLDQQRINLLLALLALAHGRLRERDLKALLGELHCPATSGRFRDQLRPIRRFVIGVDGVDGDDAESAGYILSHPKLGTYLAEEYFSHSDLEGPRAAFRHWGRGIVAALNSGDRSTDDAPGYLLQYHSQHLLDAQAPADDFFTLVEEGWLRAWERYEGGYYGFSRDVRLASEQLAADRSTNGLRYGQRLRCQLVLSCIRSLGANTPWELLVAAYEKDVLTYSQVMYWLEMKPEKERAQALAALAPLMPAEERPELLSKALGAARKIEKGKLRVTLLGALASQLPAEQGDRVLLEALRTARETEDGDRRAEALGALAPYLEADQRGEILLEALENSKSYDVHLEGWRGLASHAPVERQEMVLDLARDSESEVGRLLYLKAVLPHLPPELLRDALAIARTIESDTERALVLGALLARQLTAKQRSIVLEEALCAVRKANCHGRVRRPEVLAKLVPYLPTDLQRDALTTMREIKRLFFASEPEGKLCPFNLDGFRTTALRALTRHMPVDLLPEALSASREIQYGKERVLILVALVQFLPNEDRPGILSEALEIACKSSSSSERADSLAALAPHLPANLLGDALRAARRLAVGDQRALALVALFPRLSAEEQSKAAARVLIAARSIQWHQNQVRALGSLAPHLSADDQSKVSAEMVMSTESVDDLAPSEVLGTLAPRLSVEQLRYVLTVAGETKTGHGFACAYALAALAPHLPAGFMHDALTAASEIEDEFPRAQAVAALAPHLPAELADKALTLASEWQDQGYRSWVLVALAPRLPAELLPDALTVAREIQEHGDRAEALSALAPHLPAGQRFEILSEALAAASNIKGGRCVRVLPWRRISSAPQAASNIKGGRCVRVLRALAPRLPDGLLLDALTVAREIQEPDDRAEALGVLAPHLPAKQRPKLLLDALTATREISNDSDRINALIALVPQLLDEERSVMLSQLLTLAGEYNNGRSFADILDTMAPQLSTDWVHRGLTIAREIKDEEYRAQALGALARQLPTEEQKWVLFEALIAACETEAYQRSQIPLDLAPDLPPELLSDALATIQKVEAGSSLIRTLGKFAPYLKDEPARQGVDLLLNTIPHCEQGDALDAITEFIPLLSDLEGTIGLNEVQRAIRDTARWFP